MFRGPAELIIRASDKRTRCKSPESGKSGALTVHSPPRNAQRSMRRWMNGVDEWTSAWRTRPADTAGVYEAILPRGGSGECVTGSAGRCAGATGKHGIQRRRRRQGTSHQSIPRGHDAIYLANSNQKKGGGTQGRSERGLTRALQALTRRRSTFASLVS